MCNQKQNKEGAKNPKARFHFSVLAERKQARWFFRSSLFGVEMHCLVFHRSFPCIFFYNRKETLTFLNKQVQMLYKIQTWSFVEILYDGITYAGRVNILNSERTPNGKKWLDKKNCNNISFMLIFCKSNLRFFVVFKSVPEK